jgi:hypothetical protein
LPELRVHNFSISLDGYAAGTEMHLAFVPVLLGGGERLVDHLDGGAAGYECVELVSSPAVAHARFAASVLP